MRYAPIVYYLQKRMAVDRIKDAKVKHCTSVAYSSHIKKSILVWVYSSLFFPLRLSFLPMESGGFEENLAYIPFISFYRLYFVLLPLSSSLYNPTLKHLNYPFKGMNLTRIGLHAFLFMRWPVSSGFVIKSSLPGEQCSHWASGPGATGRPAAELKTLTLIQVMPQRVDLSHPLLTPV